MRHFLSPGAVPALAFGMPEPAGATALIAGASGPLRRRTRRLCARWSAVALAAIAGRADQALAPATGAIEQAGSGFHRRSWPMSLDPPTG